MSEPPIETEGRPTVGDQKPPFKVPHTLVLLFGMIVLAYGLTLVLPCCGASATGRRRVPLRTNCTPGRI